jgi:hypothetical protein
MMTANLLTFVVGGCSQISRSRAPNSGADRSIDAEVQTYQADRYDPQ